MIRIRTSDKLARWNIALRELRYVAPDRPPVREERLRFAAGLPLSAWRGRSGRRYVVGVHALDAYALSGLDDAVVIGVHRAADGKARILAVAVHGLARDERLPGNWFLRLAGAGANELHAHRLAGGADESRAIVEDLTDAPVARPDERAARAAQPLGPVRPDLPRRRRAVRGLAADALRHRGRG